MKIADVLRKLADTIDQHGGDHTTPDEKIKNPANMIAVDSAEDCTDCGNSDCQCDSDESDSPDDVFVPPLQTKLELLKKAVGVDNVYDDGVAGDDNEVETPDQEGDDALARMKKLAAIMTLGGDDEPLDD